MSITSDETAKGAGTGAVSGAAAGATIGSVVPGVGTVIGGVIGGVAGGVLGGIGGYAGGRKKKKAKARARAMAEAERQRIATTEANRQENIGRIREGFGALLSPEDAAKNPGRAQRTLSNRVQFGSMLDQTNTGVAGADVDALTSTTESAMNAARSSASARGLWGSSLDQANKASVASTYLGGRAAIAGEAEPAREGALRTLDADRAHAEAAATNASLDPSQSDAGFNAISDMQTARSGLSNIAFGNLLNNIAQPLSSSILMGAQNQARTAASSRYAGGGSAGNASGADTVRR